MIASEAQTAKAKRCGEQLIGDLRDHISSMVGSVDAHDLGAAAVDLLTLAAGSEDHVQMIAGFGFGIGQYAGQLEAMGIKADRIRSVVLKGFEDGLASCRDDLKPAGRA